MRWAARSRRVAAAALQAVRALPELQARLEVLVQQARRALGQGGRQGGPGGGGGANERVNWDTPYIISPHNSRRLYWASQYVYRSDDRGDNWTRVSPDLSRNLDAFNIPIMGKVWPRDSVALNTSTTPLSNVVTLDESPLLEGLIYAGTDDGLIQVTEDGGKNWRKIEQFPNVPQWTYVTDVFASPREADTVFATLNNWQRGDYKPYVVKSTDRGKTWTNITGNLPAKHDTWAIVQDHVNGNLLFVGTEFGLFVSFDGGQKWTSFGAECHSSQIRDLAVQKSRERSRARHVRARLLRPRRLLALREVSTAALAEDARIFPLRDAYLYNLLDQAPAGSAGLGLLSGLWSAPNPPFGAVFTYHVRQALPTDQKLVLTITDENGRMIRRLDLDGTPGLRRTAWNLRGEAPAATDQGQGAGGRGGRGGGGGGGGGGRGGGRGGAARSARRARPLSRDARSNVRRHRHAHWATAIFRSRAGGAIATCKTCKTCLTC